jgi:hypothetical protein
MRKELLTPRARAWFRLFRLVTHPRNERLYTLAGLERARAALRPGGVLAVWSAFSSDAFTQALAVVGSVELVTTTADARLCRAPHLAGDEVAPRVMCVPAVQIASVLLIHTAVLERTRSELHSSQQRRN